MFLNAKTLLTFVVVGVVLAFCAYIKYQQLADSMRHDGKTAYEWYLEYQVADKMLSEARALNVICKVMQNDERKIDECISDAENSAAERWKSHCKKINENEDCMLPGDTAARYSDQLTESKNFCLQRYK